MIWMICGGLIVGFLIGVVFMALLAVARDPETRSSIQDEVKPRFLHRRIAPEVAGE